MIAAVVAATAFAAPAPTAATVSDESAPAESHRSTTIIAGPATFQRGGDTYRLTFRATDGQDDEDTVLMTIRRTRDPDGTGPAMSRQTHMREFAAAHMMSSDSKLSSATVETGGKLEPYGEISVAFTPTEPAQRAPCYGAKRTVRKGRISGTVRFSSGTGFGDVEVNSMRARLDSVEGTVCLHGDPPPRCRRAGAFVWTQDGDFRASAFKPSRGNAVVVRAGRDAELVMRDPATDGYLTEHLVTRLPQNHARFAVDLSSARIRGLRGTDVRRRAVFTTSSGTMREVSECVIGREWRESVERLRRGTIGGTMRFAFFIGRDETLGDRPLRAVASRRTIHPAS